MVKTRRHILKFYVSILFALLFFIGMGFLMLSMSYEDLNSTEPAKNPFPAMVGIVFFFVGIYSVIRYFLNAPIITAEKELITFGKHTYYWKDLQSIKLTGKQPFKYFVSFPMEGCKLKFDDGEVKYIYSSMYANTWELKCFIQDVIVSKVQPRNPLVNVEPHEIEGEEFEYFKGNQFLSMRGLSLWGVLLFLGYMSLFKRTDNSFGVVFLLSCFGSFWFFTHAYLMHYFGLSAKYFIVRNHNMLWIKNIYRVENIEDIVFETYGRMPNCLRIITTDFKERLYPAGTLSDKVWLELQARLKKEGIKVRNECI
jgi:hypothetical protein